MNELLREIFNKSVILNKHFILNTRYYYILLCMLQNYLDSSYMLSLVNMEEEDTQTVHKNIVFPFPPDDVR